MTSPPVLGRIHVTGNSSSGKSSFAEALADAIGADFVELDALNWLPGWVGLNATDPGRLERRFRDATRGESWVAAGSYTAFAQRAFWPRLDTVIYLDLPMPLLVWRVLRRSWRRWRTKELLWGTNVESFWTQLALWRGDDSLVWWIATQHARKRRRFFDHVADPRWRHIRFLRLKSRREVAEFLERVREGSRRTPAHHLPSQRFPGRSSTSPGAPTIG